ncbi:MAG: STAS domain-containing protein [Marinilabiliaceae bacterium]|nr:STAS domain-containing protein [Marinilabiliaceae bacterium]
MLSIINKETKQEGILEGLDRLTALNAHIVKEELTKYLSVPNVIFTLNMENIRFIDSTGIGVLISAYKTAHMNNGIFLLSNVNKEVMTLLTLMKLDKVFNFADDI